ncbi:taurine dioxygenase [Xylogone sp. PMI_703]|nr:taurine dioxygenase [Xylogone sp. PMI_703]
MEIRRVAGSLGAEIHGVDLRSLSNDEVKKIRQALLDHKVIFFRNQDLDPAAFRAFTAHFGKPVPYPFVKGLDGFPEIVQILKRKDETINFGGIWHSDTSYFEEPPMGSVLLARELPPYGGDTLFANQVAAYEALSDGLKKTLSGLRAINTSAKADASRTREDRIRESGVKSDDLEASHPVVRTHPETGQKVLYVNVAHTARFDGWTEEESAPLLAYLFAHQIKPEFTCRFRWEPNSIAFWDNRAAQHNPINDYHGFERRMHRITLAGDRPV